MTAPSITRFLLVRIAEDEAYLSNDLNSYDSPHTSECNFPGDMTGWCDCGLRDKLLAECAAKRAIIKFHESWPVLVSRPPVMEKTSDILNDFTMRAYQESAWMTERAYVKQFGEQPPTTPILAALAAVYAAHPDYQHEWTL